LNCKKILLLIVFAISANLTGTLRLHTKEIKCIVLRVARSRKQSNGENKMTWTNINRKQPKDGEVVSTRQSGRAGYHGKTIWHKKTRTFRMYEREENRFIITIWDADEWQRNK
jgi:Tfp pilus assembly protein PilV